MLPSHIKAIHDIVNCRTEVMGGQLYKCEQCDEYHYSYHSCGNRNCNKCQSDLSQDWLEKNIDKSLPVTHFMVTFTLPGKLRTLARSNQKLFYDVLFRSSSSALQKLARILNMLVGKLE